MIIEPPTKIVVKKSPIHGLGVFASKNILTGEVFEICPILDLPIAKGESSPLLIDYRFNWPSGMDFDKQVLALGYASLYNHSNSANANWRSNININCFEFYATQDINEGQEIFIYYGGVDYWNDGRLHTQVI